MLGDFGIETLFEPLVEWFDGHARVLPWRSRPQPYRVWVSEIMLQQTRVEAVKPYFERFMERLPDVAALAACGEDELLKLWEGLGYYNRARNLKQAAIQVMEQHGGIIPSDYGELLGLKGIGHYTAGAIASIAYGVAVPAVDGNVMRIIARVMADDTDIMKQGFRKRVEETLLAAMACRDTAADGERNMPGTINQALMELGATVCLPNGAPLCGECPWGSVCLARERGLIGTLPVKSRAKARKIEERTVFVIRDGDKVAIRQRPDKGLLAGLYELPNVPGELDCDAALALVRGMHLMPLRIQRLAAAKHIFSHIEWHMVGYVIWVEEAGMEETGMEEAGIKEAGTKEAGKREGGEQEEGKPLDSLLFVEAEDAREHYAIPSAFSAYAAYMNSHYSPVHSEPLAGGDSEKSC